MTSGNMEQEGGLPRKFGFWTGLFVVIASMVGTGILTTAGYTLRSTESPTSLLLLWTAGGALALCGALTLAELATSLPKVGGEYVFVRQGFGPAFSFIYGWSTLVLGFAAPIALVADASAVYLSAPLRANWPNLLPYGMLESAYFSRGLGTLFILGFTITHSLGQRQSAWAQALTTLFKFGTLVGLAVLGLTVGTGNWAHFSMGEPILTQKPGPLATSLVYVMYGYTGWNGAVYLAGEIQEPSRNLPRCLVIGCFLVTGLYLILNVTYVYAIDPYSLRTVDGAEVEAVADLAARLLFGPRVSGVLSVLIGAGILASLSAFILTGPRVSYAMARDGLFPRYAAMLHVGRETPVAATLTLGTMAIAMLWPGTFKQLLDYTSVGLSVVAGLVVASVFPLRRLAGHRPTFRVPLYPIPPLLFLATTAWMVTYAVKDNPVPALLSLGSIALGFPVYALLRLSRRSTSPS